MPQRSGKIVMAPAARLPQEGCSGLDAKFAPQITQCRDVKVERTRTGQMPKIDKWALDRPRHAGVIMNGNRVGHTRKMPATARSNVEVRA